MLYNAGHKAILKKQNSPESSSADALAVDQQFSTYPQADTLHTLEWVMEG